MRLEQILFGQGFGTRRACRALIARGAVTITGAVCRDAEAVFAPEGLRFEVDGVSWPWHERAYVMLHKPAGYECSQRPRHWPAVYELLPPPLRTRPTRGAVAGVQAVGRLDQDTTGLLLLSDDGQFIHRMASPKHHVPKVYRVRTCHPMGDAELAALAAGVLLRDEALPVAALACERLAADAIEMTLDEGKYHQVKRMVAAVGNRVEALHRSRIGPLALDATLAEGQWRWLTPQEIAAFGVTAAGQA